MSEPSTCTDVACELPDLVRCAALMRELAVAPVAQAVLLHEDVLKKIKASVPVADQMGWHFLCGLHVYTYRTEPERLQKMADLTLRGIRFIECGEKASGVE